MVVSRSYVSTAGGLIQERRDGLAGGGPIPEGDNWEFVKCTQSVPKGVVSTAAATFEMAKLEDDTGSTVSGATSSTLGTGGTPCDSSFVTGDN